MTNYVQKGKTLLLTAPGDLTSGQGALIGSIFGVATEDVASGANGEFVVEGVVTLPKAAGAVTQGELIYWDNTAKDATTVSTSNKLIGAATLAQASADANVTVRLNGAFIS